MNFLKQTDAMEKRSFDRSGIKFLPFAECPVQVEIERDRVMASDMPRDLPSQTMERIRRTACDIVEAKRSGASRILTFGTCLIRNGLGPLVGEFVRRGWLTHLATTGTSVVDDWEFAFRGAACEDARRNLPAGTFGLWREPDLFINLAILTGARAGLGFGESIGRMLDDEGVEIPPRECLLREAADPDDPVRAAAAADLLDKLSGFDLAPGFHRVAFPYRQYSLQYMAFRAGIPMTIHPMFGLDVFFMHPLNSFAAVGRVAETDFLYFVNSVDRLEGGVYLSVGSSIASPMIFEKALSMSQNVRIREGRRMVDHKIVVVDLAESKWDWMKNGEPPETRPEYYLRYCKSFSRARARTMYYLTAEDRDFFLHLYRALEQIDR